MDTVKTFLKVGCGAVILGGILIVGLLMYGKSSGEKVVREFFEYVRKDPADRFSNRVHEELQKEAEPEVIQMFFQALEDECGPWEGLNTNGMSFSDEYKNGTRIQNYKGNFRFARNQDVPMELKLVNGKLRAFSLTNQKLAQAAVDRMRAKPLPDALTKAYTRRGTTFWRAAMGGDVNKGFDMLHENLQRQFGKAEFIKTLGVMSKQMGRLEDVRYLSSRPSTDIKGQTVFFYNLDFANKKGMLGHCSMEVVPFKGFLLGFQLPTDEKP